MIKVLLTDDEPLVLSLMKKIIPWEKYDMTVVGTAYDGDSAIAFIQQNPVDVVFTDIKMPHVDGVELIKRVKEFTPSVTFVVLSSYSDFSLVKDCFRYGAYDYLLKIDIDDTEVMEPFMEKLYSQCKIAAAEAPDTSIVFHNLPIPHTEYASYFFQMQALRLSGGLQPLQLAESLYSLQEYAAGFCYTLYQGLLLLLTYSQEKEMVVETGQFLAQQILDRYAAKGGRHPQCWIGCSEAVHTGSFDPLYQQAAEAVGYRFYYPGHSYFVYQRIPQQRYLKKLEEIQDCLEKAVYQPQITKLIQLCRELFDEAARSLVLPENLKRDAIRICSRLFQTVSGGIRENAGKIRDAADMAALKAEFEYLVNRQLILENREVYSTGDSIEAFIESHYADPSLNLAQVAEKLNIGKEVVRSYLKEYRHMQFKPYLNTVRVNHAKTLLAHAFLRVNEVSERVGYQSVEHFSRVFTQLVGISPAGYAKSIEHRFE